jgi:hypothetical protein
LRRRILRKARVKERLPIPRQRILRKPIPHRRLFAFKTGGAIILKSRAGFFVFQESLDIIYTS